MSEPRVNPPPVAVRGELFSIHGLNLKPEKMEPLEELFSQWGYCKTRLVLAGHGPGETVLDFAAVTPGNWKAQVAAGLGSLRASPVVALTYSLGSLCYLCFLAQEWRSQRDQGRGFSSEPAGHVLLAPAIGLRRRTQILRLLSALPLRNFVVPSASPRSYRHHRGTPLGAYAALFVLRVELEKNISEGFTLQNPVFFAMDWSDELVDCAKTLKMLRRLAQGGLVCHRVGPRNPLPAHHLILDPECLGQHEWGHLQAALQEFAKSLH